MGELREEAWEAVGRESNAERRERKLKTRNQAKMSRPHQWRQREQQRYSAFPMFKRQQLST